MKKEQISPTKEEEEERLLAEAAQFARREAELSPPSTTKQREPLLADFPTPPRGLRTVPQLNEVFEGREERHRNNNHENEHENITTSTTSAFPG